MGLVEAGKRHPVIPQVLVVVLHGYRMRFETMWVDKP
jgi:hypothetical protein